MANKLVVWTTLAVLGGGAYACHRGADYCRDRSQTTLSTLSDIECVIDARVESAPTQAGVDFVSLAPYRSEDLPALVSQARLPEFISAQVKEVTVKSSAGLAAPCLNTLLALRLKPGQEREARTGGFPIHFRGTATFAPTYWDAQLAPYQKEVAELKTRGTPDQVTRARSRLESMREKLGSLAQGQQFTGEGLLVVREISEVAGPMWTLLGRILAISAAVLGTLCALLTGLYVKSLKEGDIET